MIDVDDLLATHSRENLAAGVLTKLSQAFRRDGLVKITPILPQPLRDAVRDEAERLLGEFAQRRDLELATTDYSPRYMSVVTSETIAANSELIQRTYHSPQLVHMLEAIAAERMHPCPSKDEEFLISRHERKGDTHGWHWGDFSFAAVWVLRAPSIECGGLLQCVPHTNWNKSNPRIYEYLCENPIRTYHFASGDVYLLRSDTTLHRTIPLRVDVTRIMLNMTWASDADIARPLAGDDRWWEDATVAAARSRPPDAPPPPPEIA